MGQVVATNASLDDHVDAEIAECLSLSAPQSFFLLAGAGSGKTRSLVGALNHIRDQYGARLKLSGKRVGVITYTNAACDEIVRRIEYDTLFHVSTIHSFAWDLIGGFNVDIREWLRVDLVADIAELERLEAKGRKGTKASIERLSRIESKTDRYTRLDEVKSFIYSPAGDNREKNSLSHDEVIKICASFLTDKPLMQSIVVNRFPFLLIDEGQDTNKYLVDALLVVEERFRGRFSLGFFGDTMQRIYNEGKEQIERVLPTEWKKPVKKLNHRSPKRIVQLINQIRSQVDDQQQEPISTSAEGFVRCFVFPADTPDKHVLEEKIRDVMAGITQDEEWKVRDKCKILMLEHHMAAQRMGFRDVFEPLYGVSDFRIGLLEGKLPALRLFTNYVLPLVKAQRSADEFATAKIMREVSPLLTPEKLKGEQGPQKQLEVARNAIKSLMTLWKDGEPTCGDVLEDIARTGLFDIPDSLKPVVAARLNVENEQETDADVDVDRVSRNSAALSAFLDAPFDQIKSYAHYISDDSEFDTHQGVKGLEFERVMVVMDDEMARGFMFSFERLFGVKESAASSARSQEEAGETTLDRTRRLFYVTCSRARRSLALVAYTASPDKVRAQLVGAGWFEDGEVLLEI